MLDAMKFWIAKGVVEVGTGLALAVICLALLLWLDRKATR
jgi:hypothetical protein